MFEPVFVTMDTYEVDYAEVTPARIGIVKIQGCVAYYTARKSCGYYIPPRESISFKECRERYSSVPKAGEAWLVEEGRKYINWTRVDHNMPLLDYKGNIVKED